MMRPCSWIYACFMIAVAFAAGTTLVFAQEDVTLTMGSGGGSPGDAFIVSVTMNNAVPVAGLQFRIVGDPEAVDVDDVTAGDRTTGFTVSFNEARKDSINVLLFSFGTSIPVGGGEVARITFRVRQDAFSGTTPLRLIEVVASDPEARSLPVAVVDGAVTVTGGRERNAAPPAIVSGPFVVPGDMAAVITWRTDKLSTSRVEYGTNPALLTHTVQDTNLVTRHALVIRGLTPRTRYYYRVLSTDDLGRTTTGFLRRFSTVTRPDEAPPVVIVAPQTLALTPHTAVLGWTTDEQSTSTVEFGSTPGPGRVENREIFVFRHIVALTALTPDTRYFALVSDRDRNGNVGVFPDTLTFTTPVTPDSIPPRIIRRPVVSGLAPTRALIQWRTDTPSEGRVFYRALGSLDTLQATNPDETLTLEHSVTLTPLTPDTPYLYIPRSTDANGNTGGFRVLRFRTPATEDTLPPVIIRGPAVLYVSDRVIAIGWVTDEASDGFVFYKGGADSTFIPRGRPGSSRRHLVVIGGLTPGVTYTFAVTSTDPSGNTVVFPEGTVAAKPLAATAKPLAATAKPLAATARPRVVAVTADGTTVTTRTEPDNEAPLLLGSPEVTARTSTSLTIAWETDEASDSRVIYGPALSLSAADENLVASHRVTITNLEPGTTYAFQVLSTDPSGNGPARSATGAATTSTTPDTDPPVILAGSLRTAVSNDRVTVAWETDEPGDSFVEFGVSPSALTDMAASAELVTSHSLVLTHLTPSQTYFIRAHSTDLDGNGPTATSTVMVTTTATPDTARPVLGDVARSVAATTDTTATLTATWTTNEPATRRIEYGTTAALGATATDGATGTRHSLTVSRLELNTKYFFRVGSANANDPRDDRVAYSALDSVVTPARADTSAPAAPANLTAVSGNGAVRLRWDAPAGAGVAGYTILRDGAAIATLGPDTTFLDLSATNGRAQTYVVSAVSPFGKAGTASSPATATPDTDRTPTSPAVVSPAPGDTVSPAPTLVITDALPVTGDTTRAVLTYAFQVAPDSAFTTLVASASGVSAGTPGNPTHWQVADTGRPGVALLEDGVTYWWRARADDGAFNGGWSAPGVFVASVSQPTGIKLAAFSAVEERGAVTLTWTVGSGEESDGFHVLRSLRKDGGFVRITSGAVTGDGTFTYTDRGVSVNVVYYYRLEAVSTAERFGPIRVRVSAPRRFTLHQNYPNPFNPVTTIEYELPKETQVSLRVYNLRGQEVRRLVNERQEAGFHAVTWNGRNKNGRSVASGLYFYRLEAGVFSKVKKMMLVK